MLDEKDLEAIDYDENQEDLFKGESIINAVNKVFDFEKFLKDQAKGVNKPQEDLFKSESILNAANKVLDFNKIKKEQKELIIKYNKRKTFEDLQLAEIITVPKKRKVQRDKLAQIAAKKIKNKY